MSYSALEPWHSAFDSHLEKVARNAVRAIHQFPGAAAEAVWFADEAEMLAFMGFSWLDHSWQSNWCWPVLFQSAEPATIIVREWVRRPRAVPAALRILEERRQAAPFLALFDDQAITHLYCAVAEAHSWPQLPTAVPSILPGILDKRSASTASTAREALLAAATNPQPLWKRPESSAVRQAPEFASSPSQVIVPVLSAFPAPLPAIAAEPRLLGNSMTPVSAEAIDSPPILSASPHSTLPDDLPLRRQPGRPTIPAEAVVKSPAFKPEAHNEAPPVIPHMLERNVEFPRNAPHPAPLPEIAKFAERFHTRHGGAFFLLNLCLALEFYGDFTSPRRPTLGLNIWDFLALFTRWLCGETFESDSLWSYLAIFACRPVEEPPGESFSPATDWAIAAAWSSDPAPRPPSESLDAWQRWLFPMLATRLSQALGLTERDDLASLLIRHTATVQLTPLHIDVALSLDIHPIEIRIAGLDRDPGWIPAGGRDVAFRFV